MIEFNSINDILEFAMKAEQEAVDFYTLLSNQASSENMKKVFEQFAMEEIGHKKKLASVMATGNLTLGETNVPDLQISDYLVAVEAKPGMSYQEALVLAMKKEKAAFKLYMDLSEKTADPAFKSLFLSLAMEESKHKLRFEIEYDDYILKEN
jgi:rubrerythrin